jgi:tight adherence protein B
MNALTAVGAALTFGGIAFTCTRMLTAQRHPNLPLVMGAEVAEGPESEIGAKLRGSLEGSSLVTAVERLIVDSGSKRSATSTVVLTGSAAVVAAVLLLPMAFPLGSLLGLVLVPLVVRSRLRSRVRQRRERFVEQLPNTLQMLSSMLRSGYGLLQSLSEIAEEAEDPTSAWFHRVISETRAGRDLRASLNVLAEQIGSADFDWVVSAIEISSDVGGNLASTFDTLAQTVRERDQLRGQVRALTAEGRLSAYLMLGLPPIVLTMSMLVNPEFAQILFRGVGRILLFSAVMLMVLGYFWMRRIIAKVG